MKQAITYTIQGIKCDNPTCGWSDMNAPFIPDFWLNKPCPMCKSNLFTQADYDAMNRLLLISKIFNILAWPFIFWRKTKIVHKHLGMNGTGIIFDKDKAK